MSNNGNDDKLSPGEVIFLLALFTGTAIAIFALVRWMITTKAGMITAAVAFVVLLFLHFTGTFDQPKQVATVAQSHQSFQPSTSVTALPGYIEQNLTPPDVSYRINRGQVCATLNGVTSCSPINR